MARQTVFFSAFSRTPVTRESLEKLTRNITRLAPDLLHGFEGGRSGQPLTGPVLSRIISLQQVEDLSAYPDSWSMVGDDMFEARDLPLLRVFGVNRAGGPDEKGHHGMVLVLATHSLFEGEDAARLSRSQNVERGDVVHRPPAVSRGRRLAYRALAAALAPVQIMAAHLLAPRVADLQYRSLVLDRARLREAAQRLGIRQRSLIFALTTYVLNDGGKGFSRKRIRANYTDLSKTDSFQTNDDYFQFRLIDLNIPVRDDFEEFARGLDAQITRAESGDRTATQTLLNAMFGTHRWLHARFPSLYSAQLFRFSAGYHITLSVVPPQRLSGEIVKDLDEPVFTGTYHPGLNICVFAPGRRFVTLNLCLRAQHMAKLERMKTLFDSLG